MLKNRWSVFFQAMALASMISLAAPDNAMGAPACGLGNSPAATVFLPYFEVELDKPDGRNTLFSVSNIGSRPTLAHAVVWSNWGQPILSFDFFIPSQGRRSLNVRSLLEGRLPPSPLPPEGYPPGQTFPSCADPVTLPQIAPELARALLSGEPHPEDGLCYGSAVPGGMATGSITVDVVRDCSGDALVHHFTEGYFEDGGTGLATNRNLLAGDFMFIDPSNDFAQGAELVSLIADADRFETSAFHFNSNRMPLAKTYRTRFIRGGAFSGGTELLVWIEGKTAPAPCGDPFPPNSSLYNISVKFRDEAGNPLNSHTFITAEQSFRASVGGELFPTEANFGTADIRAIYLFVLGIPEEAPVPLWVMPLVSADQRYSAGFKAVVVEDFCQPTTNP